MGLLKLTISSMISRRLPTILLIASIALSTMLLIGVQKVKLSAKKSFSHSISDTDLIIGARSGQIQLLLTTVFRHGQPVANIAWDSVTEIAKHPDVKWLVPLSLGDSHRGFPVIGTSNDYFNHYKYGDKFPLKLQSGRSFESHVDIVLGSEVAKELNYALDDQLYLSHGMGKERLRVHKNQSFKVVGILNPTGTPVDKTLHISLEGFQSLHMKGNTSNDAIDRTPTAISGCLVGLKSKFSIFSMQREINDWKKEALMAVIPGVALANLWQSIGTIDQAFWIITLCVVVIACIGLLLGLFMALNQRTRELTILRLMGARPLHLSVMLMMEALIITCTGVLLGMGGILILLGQLFKPLLEEKLGLILSLNSLSFFEWSLGVGIILFGVMISIIPAILAYKKGQAQGFRSL